MEVIRVIHKGRPEIPALKAEWALPLIQFLEKWETGKEHFEVQTSGSTGKPKLIQISRSAMLESAGKTNKFFRTNSDSRALLPLSARFIGGKMMAVRAIEGGYDLYAVEPSSHFFESVSGSFDLVSMVPLQFRALIPYPPKAKKLFKHILLGGANLSLDLEQQVREESINNVYLGFGMTETVSHFALRKIGDDDPSYQCLDGVSIGMDESQRLWVDIPGITEGRLQTNDVVDLTGNDQFVWRGRSDWVINSGGIKIHPEELEQKIADFFSQPFLLSSLPDEQLGSKLVLVIEGNEMPDSSGLLNKIRSKLPAYHRPKEVHFVKEFPLTGSGKVSRLSVRELISNN
jgi:O-succinylbenzoic acid--CoA ligase